MHHPYYSPHPLLVLDRPVALIGFLGARVPQIAATFSATTGVPLSDLERLIEHRTGRSLARFVHESGQDALHRLEAELLGGLLRSRPAPIIALGPATLQHAPSARLLKKRSQLIYIRRSLLTLYGNLLDELDAATSRCWMFPGARPDGVGAIQPVFAAHRLGYEAVPRTLDAAGRSPVAIAGELAAMLRTDPGAG